MVSTAKYVAFGLSLLYSFNNSLASSILTKNALKSSRFSALVKLKYSISSFDVKPVK